MVFRVHFEFVLMRFEPPDPLKSPLKFRNGRFLKRLSAAREQSAEEIAQIPNLDVRFFLNLESRF